MATKPSKRKSSKELRKEALTPIEEKIEEFVEETDTEAVSLLREYLAKHQKEQPTERIPGRTVRGIKTAWSYSDMVKRFPISSFVPEETIPLTWNGVTVQAYSGIEMHAPKPFYDLYREHRKRLGEGSKNLPDGFIIDLGAGALPPEA